MRAIRRSFSLAAAAALWGAAATVIASAAAAQTPSRRVEAGVASEKVTLLAQEDGWATALIQRDEAYFRRMLAPGFVYTEDDRLSTRDEVLRDMISPGDTVTAARNEGMAVHLSGATGVVTGLLIVQGRSRGARYEHRYRFTDTWVKQSNGSWQIFAAQDYLVPGPARR
jgi:hypothetical protein